MSFRPNPPSFQQLSLFDGYRMLSDKKRRMLKDSWATTFRDEIYANLDEEPYMNLFDEEGAASRPNFPINTLVSASIIKKMFVGLDAIAFNVMKLIRFRRRQRVKCALA